MNKIRHQVGNAGWRRRGRIITAVAAALAVTLTVPALRVPVRAVDLEKGAGGYSVTVKVPDGSYEELKTANVVVDYVKIADASPMEGYDAYTLAFTDAYAELGTKYGIELNLTKEDILDGADESQFEAKYKEYSENLAQKALETALTLKDVREDDGTGSNLGTVTDLSEGKKKIAFDEPGMYLVFPHGEQKDDESKDAYKRTVTDGDVTTLATVAYSDTKVYTFSPIIVTIPEKADEGGNYTHNTGAPGEWVYDLEVNVKATEEPRYTKLVIEKDLTNIEQRTDLVNLDDVTCVYQVEGTIGTKNVYSHTVSIVLDAAGKKSVTLDRIPIGATVKVTEVYTGAEYELTSEESQELVMKAQLESDNPQRVEFTNQYAGTDHGGGSLTNHFTYENEEDGWQIAGEDENARRKGSPDMKPYTPAQAAQPAPQPDLK